MSDNRQDRRYPQNLQGVLQLAVEAGSAAEGPVPSEPMSEEVGTTTLAFNTLTKNMMNHTVVYFCPEAIGMVSSVRFNQNHQLGP